MEILDPDLWNDDGTPKRPTKAYMDSLEQAQSGADGAFLNYARIKREAKQERGPEVGDIVHAYSEEGVCRAAIVLETSSFTHTAELRVHIPHKAFEDWAADHDENKSDLTWHWPCGEGR